MEFSPSNPIVRLCLQGMSFEEKKQSEEALAVFTRAWNEAAHDFEKFLAAFYIARQQKNIADKLKWYELSLQAAQNVGDVTVQSAYPTLYTAIARCCEETGDAVRAQQNQDLAISLKDKITDPGPFYHGTKADLPVGGFLTPGNRSNYQEEIIMNHVYFTGIANGAGLAAALAKGEGRERVYLVEPTGSFENDPNLTDKKFPGNMTRSYRTEAPLKIIGEVPEWARQTEKNLDEWRRKLANNPGEIIN